RAPHPKEPPPPHPTPPAPRPPPRPVAAESVAGAAGSETVAVALWATQHIGSGNGFILPEEIKSAAPVRPSLPRLLRCDRRGRLPCIECPCPVSSLSRPVVWIVREFVPSPARLCRYRPKFSAVVFVQ